MKVNFAPYTTKEITFPCLMANRENPQYRALVVRIASDTYQVIDLSICKGDTETYNKENLFNEFHPYSGSVTIEND